METESVPSTSARGTQTRTRASRDARRRGRREVRRHGPSERERHLWARCRHHDPEARDELTRLHMPLAERLASRYRDAPEPYDDLVQVGNLALVKAIDRFDPDRGIPFPAYAVPTILGELKRHFRDHAWTMRVPRGLHDMLPRIERAAAKLSSELQRSPTPEEIASELGTDPDEVLEAMEASNRRRLLSFDRPLGGEETETPAAETVGSEDPGFELAEDRLAVAEALEELEPREREVLRLRFAEDLTQAQIAERIGCSQMHVSRILRAILTRLNERVERGGQRTPEAVDA